MSQESVAATLDEANQFDTTGPIVINYSRSSITGAPLLSYKDAESDLNFSGAAITQAETPAGEFVTIKLQDVPDAFVRTFTLILPNIRLQTGDQLPFDTIGIETTDYSGAFAPPPGPAGVLQTYRIHQLSGVAQHVIF
jgi:hypothetical protein